MRGNSIIESLEIRRELKRLDEWVIKNLGVNAGIELKDGEMKPVIAVGTGISRYTSSYYVTRLKELLNLSLTKLLKAYFSKNEMVASDSDIKNYVLKIQDTLLSDKSSKPFTDILNKCLVDIGLPDAISKVSSEALEGMYKKMLGYNPT
jgi:hypothetical protein